MAEPPRGLTEAERDLLDLAMLAALDGVEPRDLPMLGSEVLRLLPQQPPASPIAEIAGPLGAAAEDWAVGGDPWYQARRLRQACAGYFRARHVHRKRGAGR